MEDDIEKIREEKLEDLKEQKEEEQKAEQAKNEMLRKLLTEEARQRLKNVRMIDEEKADLVERSILSQRDKIHKLDDDDMKQMLRKVENKMGSSDMNIKSRDL